MDLANRTHLVLFVIWDFHWEGGLDGHDGTLALSVTGGIPYRAIGEVVHNSFFFLFFGGGRERWDHESGFFGWGWGIGWPRWHMGPSVTREAHIWSASLGVMRILYGIFAGQFMTLVQLHQEVILKISMARFIVLQ